jgi:HK97 family phage major capsid protein/HK97 family phage prohead protease
MKNREVKSKEVAYARLDVKSIDKQKRVITGTATTPTPDRVGDIINPLGVEFKNPMPLLWQHKSDQPIGLVRFDKPTKSGIKFEATLPQPADLKSENLRARIEEAIESVELGLVRATSIGFRPIKYAFMDDGGVDFQESEVMELSLVTIPANAEATIATIKHFAATSDTPDKTELSPPKAVAPPRGDNVVTKTAPTVKASSTGKETSKMSKTIAEKISAFEASRAAKAAAVAKLAEGEGDEMVTLTPEQKEQHDTLMQEIKDIDEHLVRLHDAEKLAKDAAKPVTSETITEEKVSRDPIRATAIRANVPKGQSFVRYAQALTAGKGSVDASIRFCKSAMKRGGWDNTPEVLDWLELDVSSIMREKAAVGVGTTTDATWASPLIAYNVMASEFIEYLRPNTIIGRIPGLRRVPFNIQMPRTTSASSAGWVGENAPKPVSAMAFDTVQLRWAKAAGIVVLTDELVRFSNPSAEAVVRQDLVDTITQFLDRQFVDPSVAAVTNVSPASITNGVTGVTPTGTNEAALRTDVATLFANLLTLNLSPSGGVWIMTQQQALRLSLMVNSLGQPSFPNINAEGGTLFGYPVISSENIPSTTGSPTEGYPIIFAVAKEILLADDGQVVLDASNQASIQLDSAPDSPPGASTAYISMWQMNMTGLRAERWINWLKRRTGVVQFISSALYR